MLRTNSDYQTTTSYTLTTAQALPFGKVYWRAQAKDAAGNESGWSDARWFNVTILKAPANGSFTTNTKPPFSWAAAAGALELPDPGGYDDPGFHSPEINEPRPPSTSYTHPTPLAFGKYYWRMQVNTPGGWGDWTPANQFTVSPPLLPAPVLDSPANASYTNVPQPLFTGILSLVQRDVRALGGQAIEIYRAGGCGDQRPIWHIRPSPNGACGRKVLLEGTVDQLPGSAGSLVFRSVRHGRYHSPSVTGALHPTEWSRGSDQRSNAGGKSRDRGEVLSIPMGRCA